MSAEPAQERELKLEPARAFSLARLGASIGAYAVSAVACERLHTLYYDTVDLRLARWGCSLRFRRGEGWTLKLPLPSSGQGLARSEHVFAGDAGTIPAGALELATAYLRGERPRRVAELRTLRTKRNVLDEGGERVAEIVEDDVRVVDGSRIVRRFRQVEIELKDHGSEKNLDALADLLAAEGAGAPDATPKNVAALGEDALAPELAAELSPDASAAALARAALARSVEKLLRNDAKLRIGPDVDAVHDARVAVRRLRSDLRSFLPLFVTEWACGLRERLRWLADGLGNARDADVLLERLERAVARLPESDRRTAEKTCAPLRAAREEAYASVRAMLRDERYVPLLQEVVNAAKAPPLVARASDPASDVVLDVVADAWKAARKAVRRAGAPPSDAELHRIRIKTKRVRYVAEAVAPIAGRGAAQLAEAAEALQTLLGDQHDAVVARGRLRELARGNDADVFVAGELAGLEYMEACEGRARWRDAWRRVRKRWKRLG
jgi:CHAD domain-containing protein